MFDQFTLGIEEEFQIVDPQTRELRSHVAEILEEGKMLLGEQIKPEMIQSMVEVGTGICRNIQEARADITENISLAAMETLVHLGAGGLPLNRYLVRIDIPDDVWAAAEWLDASTAPVGWDALPAGRASIAFGTAWLTSKRSACLFVPSIITPEEKNVLINPVHPDLAKITAKKVRKWLYDPRFLATK